MIYHITAPLVTISNLMMLGASSSSQFEVKFNLNYIFNIILYRTFKRATIDQGVWSCHSTTPTSHPCPTLSVSLSLSRALHIYFSRQTLLRGFGSLISECFCILLYHVVSSGACLR